MLTMLARLQVEATDADKGDNAEVEYSLVTSPSSPESFFSIDRTTGQLTTLKVGGQTQTGRNERLPICCGGGCRARLIIWCDLG